MLFSSLEVLFHQSILRTFFADVLLTIKAVPQMQAAVTLKESLRCRRPSLSRSHSDADGSHSQGVTQMQTAVTLKESLRCRREVTLKAVTHIQAAVTPKAVNQMQAGSHMQVGRSSCNILMYMKTVR